MTPTTDQIEAETERAYGLITDFYYRFGWGVGELAFVKKSIASALTARAKEARMEALTNAMDAIDEIECATKSPCDVVNEIYAAIRALMDGTK